MILEINDKTTIKDIQKQFRKTYPFLKIEFSDKPHQFGEVTKGGHWYDPSFRLFKISRRNEVDYIEMQPWSRTGDVEEAFQRKFGLHPQIFRREEYQWIQTAGTDMFTLDEQNEIGQKTLERRANSYWIQREVLL